MGSRANLIVVRGGKYDLHYSHWGADVLPYDLFWGPQHAIAFSEAQPVVEAGWLNDVWAEGGSVIDTDRRIFRVFGGEDLPNDVPLRRIYLALLGVVWQGWDVGWAEEGVADLADLVGYPREEVICSKGSGMTSPDFRVPADPNWVELIGSLRLNDGSLRLFPLQQGPEHFLLCGQSLAEVATTQPGLERLTLAEWTKFFPKGGFHLDLRSDRLDYWSSETQPGALVQIVARWPEWSVTWLRDRYEDQLTACEGRLTFPDRTPAALLSELRPGLLGSYGASPAQTFLEIDEKMRAAGKVVTVNPLSLSDDRVEIPIETREEILQKAAAQLGIT